MMIVLLCNSENFKRKIYIKSCLKYLEKQVLLKTGMNKPEELPAFFSYIRIYQRRSAIEGPAIEPTPLLIYFNLIGFKPPSA